MTHLPSLTTDIFQGVLKALYYDYYSIIEEYLTKVSIINDNTFEWEYKDTIIRLQISSSEFCISCQFSDTYKNKLIHDFYILPVINRKIEMKTTYVTHNTSNYYNLLKILKKYC